jgi:hypothetical protein
MMQRLVRLLVRSAAVGVILWLGRPKQAPPLPPMPPPRKSFLDRFRIFEVIQAIASIATVIALVFAFQAVREAQRQVAASNEAIQVSRGQVQPTFQWYTQSSADLNGSLPERRDLTLTMYGGAERVKVQVTTLLVFPVGSVRDLHIAYVSFWWEEVRPNAGQLAVLRSKPSSLRQFLAEQDRTLDGLTFSPPWTSLVYRYPAPLYIGTGLKVTYMDVFGNPQERYYRMVEERSFQDDSFGLLGQFGSQPIPVSAEAAKDCLAMIGALSRENSHFDPNGVQESVLTGRSLIEASARVSESQLGACF